MYHYLPLHRVTCGVQYDENAVNVCEALGVEIIKCNCHRVNSAILWSLGFGCSGVLQEQSDGRPDEAGSVCRCLQPLRRQQRHAEGTPEAGGGPPPYIRAHGMKRHEVICIFKFVFVLFFHLKLSSGNCLCCSCNARFILYFYSPFLFFSG